LISHPVMRPAWMIARSMWSIRRTGFLALLSAPLAFGWVFHLLPPNAVDGGESGLLGFLPMGLSLFLTFVFCGFTESNSRGQSEGFPSRLFTLPVATRILIRTPIAFSVLAVGIIYTGWVTLALPALGRNLPLLWPLLYLATGMICYHTIVWTLARFRIARLIVLGFGGTFLSLGWLALRQGVERDLFAGVVPEDVDVHSSSASASAR
jgi:hypothetical protein